ncbi:MAG: PocR ligand-binding domain-containing protein [Lachnospiraceae bacterium]|nr:PocR ligand-binding domain-containing protein [Lachnospiraceae bacterium]
MVIQDFTDMVKFEQIISNWAKATGLATVAVGADGKYIPKCYNFTDFCINLTRGCNEGKRRCEKCDREGKGVYHCHAGLIDFGIDLIVNGQKMGSVIGGQVLPKAPNKEKFREVARELGIDEDVYLRALDKVPVRTEDVINASAQLLGEVMNDFINSEYNAKYNVKLLKNMTEGVRQCEELVAKIQKNTDELNHIQHRQNILALNASIEAARAGEMGRGFNVVAKQVGDLSVESRQLNEQIANNVTRISEIVHGMAVNNE